MRLTDAAALTIVCIVSSCSPHPGPDKTAAGAVLGAAWGAGSGAIIGNQVNAVGPGAAIGAGFGAVSGLITGAGMDIVEGAAIDQQEELDALKVRVAANRRALLALQDELDDREMQLAKTAVSHRVFFDSNLAGLRLGAAKELERFAENIKKNPFVGKVEVHGHTDNTGNRDTDQQLSEARARTVATFLISHGISSDQIVTIGHGASEPLATNETEVGKQMNRRVELVLLKQ